MVATAVPYRPPPALAGLCAPHAAAAEAGRDPAEVPVTVWGVPEDADRLRRYRDQGVARVVVSLPSEPAAKTLPRLDHWAELIRETGR